MYAPLALMVHRMAKQQSTSLQELTHGAWGNSRTVDDVDPETAEAVSAYVGEMLRAMKTMDVPPLVAVLLYGSRARGDHTVESDADLALVLQGYEFGRALKIHRDLCRATYEIEARYEFMVSPKIIWSDVLDSPATSSNPAFYHNLLAEGIPWRY